MEDNISPTDTFAPSIFDTVREIGFGKDGPVSSQTPTVEEEKLVIDLDTAKILIEIPFDIASQVCKMNDICLTEKQSEKLGKLWRAPLQRYLAKYEDSDLIIAAAATLAIAGDKYLEYKSELSRRNNTGDERKRENELREKQVT